MSLHFPVSWQLGPLRVSAHFVFEALAYALAFRVYLAMRKRWSDPVASSVRTWVITAAALGSVVGSKLLFLFEEPSQTIAHWNDPAWLMGGKTIVGALIGGWIGVEWIKKKLGEKTRTGDLFAVPLCVGIAVGRIGCFLTGVEDHTAGVAASLPWAVDFGDGVRRHPTQIYEVLFLLILGAVLLWMQSRPHRNGDVFKAFMVGYMGWRLAVGFIQPLEPIAGLGAIQWACVGVIVFYAVQFMRLRKMKTLIEETA